MKQFILCLFLFAFLTSKSQQHKPIRLRYFMQAAPAAPTSIPYGANPEAGHYAKTVDAKIYYEVYGKGPTVVLLHGGVYGSTMEMFQFIDSLSITNQVIAVSTRGHGKSEMGNAPVSYDQKVADVTGVIDQVTRDSVTILGFSDGAYTGYKLASVYPAKVKKLITIRAGEQVPGSRKVVFDTASAFRLDSLYWKQQLSLMPEPKRLQEYWTGMAKFYNSMTASKELFASIQCPVLVMAGERDRNAPLATVIAAYLMIRNSQLAIIPNASHPVFLENFAAVWASIVPFLRK